MRKLEVPARRLLRSLVPLFLVLPCAHASAQARWVIGPDQGDVLTAMLGGTEGIDGCTFVNADVDRAVVRVTFRCPDGSMLGPIELSHRGKGPCRDVCSSKFVIAMDDASAGRAGFPAALLARIRAHERRFAWTAARRDSSERGAGARRSELATYAANGAVLLVAAAVVLRIVLRARRAA